MRLRSTERRLSWGNLSTSGTLQRPLTWRAARPSSRLKSAFSVAVLASFANSRCDRTRAQLNGVNAVLDSSQQDLGTMKRLSVFAAPLLWAD